MSYTSQLTILLYNKTVAGLLVAVSRLQGTPLSHAYRLVTGRNLHMIGICRCILRRKPHDHNRNEENNIEQAPNAVVNASSHLPPPHLQPLVLPHVGGEIIQNNVGEADKRDRGQNDRHNEQETQLLVDLKLSLLLLLHQRVHCVHQRHEYPEVHDGVDSTVKPTIHCDDDVRANRTTSTTWFDVG